MTAWGLHSSCVPSLTPFINQSAVEKPSEFIDIDPKIYPLSINSKIHSYSLLSYMPTSPFQTGRLYPASKPEGRCRRCWRMGDEGDDVRGRLYLQNTERERKKTNP